MQKTNTNGSGFLIALLALIVLALAGMLYLEKAKVPATQAGASVIDIDGSTYAKVAEIEGGLAASLSDSGDADFVVYEGATWVKVNGQPVEVMVVNRPDCGQPCDTSQVIATMKQIMTPALVVNEIDIESERGQALAAEFNLTHVPSYFVGTTVEQSDFYEQGAQALKKGSESELYFVDGTQFRFPKGQLINPPVFDAEGDYTIGSDDAPVKVVEFYAFECGYCNKFYTENKATITELADAGDIQFIVKDFPLWGDSNHLAAACFGQQGKFWEAHDDMFENSTAWSRATDGGAAYYDGLITKLGIDKDQYEACLVDPAVKAEIAADQAEGRSYGVTGTPALFVGSQFVPGAISPEQLKAMVEAAK